eukprot:UN33831
MGTECNKINENIREVIRSIKKKEVEAERKPKEIIKMESKIDQINEEMKDMETEFEYKIEKVLCKNVSVKQINYIVCTLKCKKTDHKSVGFALTHDNVEKVMSDIIQDISPKIIGKSIDQIIKELGKICFDITEEYDDRSVKKTLCVYALTALNNAIWDLYSKRKGLPLWKTMNKFTSVQLSQTLDFQCVNDIINMLDIHDLITKNEKEQQMKVDEKKREQRNKKLSFDIERNKKLSLDIRDDYFVTPEKISKKKCRLNEHEKSLVFVESLKRHFVNLKEEKLAKFLKGKTVLKLELVAIDDKILTSLKNVRKVNSNVMIILHFRRPSKEDDFIDKLCIKELYELTPLYLANVVPPED